MTPYPVKGAQLPIPFHRFLKVVAIVDRTNPQIQQLLDSFAAHHYEVEVTDSYERDVSEDAAVGAYRAPVVEAHVVGPHLARGADARQGPALVGPAVALPDAERQPG